nr:GNAT family N-acetyltransferase [Massilia sp. ZL223]
MQRAINMICPHILLKFSECVEVNEIQFESVSKVKVRLKYLLGELVLGNWYPELLVLIPKRFEQEGWPSAPEVLAEMLGDENDGVFCRKVPAENFKPGLRKYGSFLGYVPCRDVLYYVSVSGSFTEYLNKFSTKSRQNLTRSVRRFAERQQGLPSWEVYVDYETISEFYSEALRISKQTYQTKLLHAGLADSEAFLAHMKNLARNGQARGYLLRDSGRAIAFAWCRQQGDRLIYDTVGYLPEFSNLSAGTVLLYHIIEDVFSSGNYKEIDFGPGEAQYKSMFSTHRKEFVDLYLLRDTVRHRILVSAHYYLLLVSGAIGRLLERYGVKKYVKAWIRRLKS